MKNLIDFRKKPIKNVAFIQPNFTLYNRDIEIKHFSANETFRITVGCQNITINENIVNIMLEEIEFAKPKSVDVTVIVSKYEEGSKPKVTKTSPILQDDTSELFYISTSDKCYSKSIFTTYKNTITILPKHFKKHGDNTYFRDYSLTVVDITNIKHILNTLKDYYNSFVTIKATKE